MNMVADFHVIMEAGFIEFLTDTGPVVIGQWIGIVMGFLGIGWGIKEKMNANRVGSQTIEKNTFDQLVEENKLMVLKLQKMRKDQDKWHIVRLVLLGIPDGQRIISETETAADLISSDE